MDETVVGITNVVLPIIFTTQLVPTFVTVTFAEVPASTEQPVELSVTKAAPEGSPIATSPKTREPVRTPKPTPLFVLLLEPKREIRLVRQAGKVGKRRKPTRRNNTRATANG
jgi:hypothetical protein